MPYDGSPDTHTLTLDALNLIRIVRSQLVNHPEAWCEGAMARNNGVAAHTYEDFIRADTHCAMGWLHFLAGSRFIEETRAWESPVADRALEILTSRREFEPWRDITHVNDRCGREAVITLFDQALER